MSLHRLLPNTTKRKNTDGFSYLLYIATTKWGWSYQQFVDTPLTVILSNLRHWVKEQKEKQKAYKK